MVEAQVPPVREFLPEHSLCWVPTLGATTVIVPLRSPLSVRPSTQPRPLDGETAGRGDGEGVDVEVIGAVEVPQAATSRASTIAARRPAAPGMCRRMLTVTRATALEQATHEIES